MKIDFTKMHGLGNDFMVINQVTQNIQINSEQIRRLADRHTGVGFDQLLMVSPPSSCISCLHLAPKVVLYFCWALCSPAVWAAFR